MEGCGDISNDDKIVSDRCQLLAPQDCSWNNNRIFKQWYTAVPPLLCGRKLSPADYFARTMAENAPDDVKIGIVITASGGTDIRLYNKRRSHSTNLLYNL